MRSRSLRETPLMTYCSSSDRPYGSAIIISQSTFDVKRYFSDLGNFYKCFMGSSLFQISSWTGNAKRQKLWAAQRTLSEIAAELASLEKKALEFSNLDQSGLLGFGPFEIGNLIFVNSEPFSDAAEQGWSRAQKPNPLFPSDKFILQIAEAANRLLQPYSSFFIFQCLFLDPINYRPFLPP